MAAIGAAARLLGAAAGGWGLLDARRAAGRAAGPPGPRCCGSHGSHAPPTHLSTIWPKPYSIPLRRGRGRRRGRLKHPHAAMSPSAAWLNFSLEERPERHLERGKGLQHRIATQERAAAAAQQTPCRRRPRLPVAWGVRPGIGGWALAQLMRRWAEMQAQVWNAVAQRRTVSGSLAACRGAGSSGGGTSLPQQHYMPRQFAHSAQTVTLSQSLTDCCDVGHATACASASVAPLTCCAS